MDNAIFNVLNFENMITKEIISISIIHNIYRSYIKLLTEL